MAPSHKSPQWGDLWPDCGRRSFRISESCPSSDSPQAPSPPWQFSILYPHPGKNAQRRPLPPCSTASTERAISHGPVPNVIVASQHRASERMRMVRGCGTGEGVRMTLNSRPTGGQAGDQAGPKCKGPNITLYRMFCSMGLKVISVVHY